MRIFLDIVSFGPEDRIRSCILDVSFRIAMTEVPCLSQMFFCL